MDDLPPIAARFVALVALVAIGGAVGAGARHVAFEAFPVAAGTFPTTTLCVNVAGALLLGVVVARLGRVWWARPLLGVGVLSGLTTMSTLAVEVASLCRTHHWATASAYVAATLVFGIGAAMAGLRTGAR